MENLDLLQKRAKRTYVKTLRNIVIYKNFSKKIESLLPEHWRVRYNQTFEEISVVRYADTDDPADSSEFKLVCKVVETIVGDKLCRDASASKEGTITSLYASGYFKIHKKYMSISVCLTNPKNMPDCEITWKRTWKKEAVVSDACLGIGD